jgi:Ca2+:H+ antiporter
MAKNAYPHSPISGTTTAMSSEAVAGKSSIVASLQQEWLLGAAFATTALFLLYGEKWLADLSNPLWFGFMLLWLFAVIMGSAFAVVHHAESLAVRLGEPLGTLVLTLSVIGIEVMMISAVMLTGEGKPALARDTMFGIVMIVLNGMVGLSLLLGGLRHHEQEYNLQGANAFLSLIISLTVLGLILPNYTRASPGPTLSTFQSVFLAIMSLAIYSVFLVIQNWRHRDYFLKPAALANRGQLTAAAGDAVPHATNSLTYHSVLLLMYLLPLVVLAKKIALPIDHGIEVLHAPLALGGFLVAALILSPESLSATRAALANDLQRSINILLGSVLASIGLTIPAVLTIGLITGKTVVLGLDPGDSVLLVLTLSVCGLTFTSTRTNVLLGAVHLLLFLAYLMLIFEH